MDAVLEGSREDYAPRGEEVFTETFRHMAREIENRKYDRYANAPGNYDKLYAYAETPAGMDGMKRDLSEILDFIDREQGFTRLSPRIFQGNSNPLHYGLFEDPHGRHCGHRRQQ